ncbi:MAG: hypothetical protein OEU54_02120 [Gemmatimonadota bacterium]|nr:hypothetical protein [Gemmatimonadota bacterium]
MQNSRLRPSRRILRASGLAVAILASAGNASAQDREPEPAFRHIDRWLVTGVSVVEGTHPLEGDQGRVFPDRDLELGPGYWTLVREDGATSIALDRGSAEAEPAALAHAYVRSPSDVTVDLRLEVPECAQARAWVNGQSLASDGSTTAVRLGGGWNTLLVSVTGKSDCNLRLGATIEAATPPARTDEDAADLAGLSVQASRPPGARPNYPGGAVLVGEPVPVAIAWPGAEDDLRTEIEVPLTAWGRPGGIPAAAGGEDRPTGPPTIDLTGEWRLTLYTPTGIVNGLASLEMSEGGELIGRVEGERIDGEIRDGWVSGDQFGWRIRLGGRGRDIELRMRGVLSDDGMMSGSMDFGGFREFEARFEGEPAGEDDKAGDEPEQSNEEGEREPVEMPRTPAPGDQDPAESPEDELAGPPDPDGLRQRIMRTLLPPPEDPPDPAPTEAVVELSIAGGDIEEAIQDLRPLRPVTVSGSVEFRRARSAALDSDGFEARVRWNNDDYDFVGSVSPEGLLAAFHGEIRLTGWGLQGVEGFAGSFRVPAILDGFTLGLGPGSWTVDGSPDNGTELCSPCEEGRTIEIRVTGTDAPVVFVSDPGYPGSAEGVPTARDWLEALRGDNERYRELGRTAGGGL